MRAPIVRAITSNGVETQTIGAMLRWARGQIAPISPSARIDTEILLQYCIDRERAWLLAHYDELVATREWVRFRELVQRRTAGEPIAHIIGVCGFWSFDLRVTPDTLIPRPETELLVEHALARIPVEAPWHIADLGTGCGAIALAIAAERPTCRITATDICDEALAVARHNCERLALPNIEFRCGDWFAPVASQRFHMIVANPPYVAQDDPHLDQDGLKFEPRLALVSGPHGMEALQVIVAQAPHHLEADGWLLVEHGYDQASVIRQAMRTHAGENIVSFRDYAGLNRVSACQFNHC